MVHPLVIGRRCLRNEFDKLRLVQSPETVRAPKPYALLGKDTIAIEFLRDTKPLKTPESMPADRFQPATSSRTGWTC